MPPLVVLAFYYGGEEISLHGHNVGAIGNDSCIMKEKKTQNVCVPKKYEAPDRTYLSNTERPAALWLTWLQL